MLVDGKEFKFSSASSSHQVNTTPTVLLNLHESFITGVGRDGWGEFDKKKWFIYQDSK